jgi:hypothetical protein
MRFLVRYEVDGHAGCKHVCADDANEALVWFLGWWESGVCLARTGRLPKRGHDVVDFCGECWVTEVPYNTYGD